MIRLLDIANNGYGLSGRLLRKLPLLAYVSLVRYDKVNLATFLDALDDAVDEH